MTPNNTIQRPKGECLAFRNYKWHVIFYENGIRKRKSLSTEDYEIAKFRRDLFFHDAEKYEHKTSEKPLRYIYKQKPYYVKIGKKLVGRYNTRAEAVIARDEYEMKRGGDAM